MAELIPIHSDRVTRIERDAAGRTYYTVKGLRLSPNEILRDDALWHLRRAPLTVDGLRGLSVVGTGRETFGRAIGVREWRSPMRRPPRPPTGSPAGRRR